MTLNVSTVSGNTTGDNGGGIENHGTATLNVSTVSGNTGTSGGGIVNNGTATLNLSAVSNNSSIGGSGGFCGGGGLSNGMSTGTTTIELLYHGRQHAAYVGGGIFAGGGPMNINHSIVTGNSALTAGGGMIVWDGPTTVANSAFFNNSDHAADQGFAPDSPAGVWVSPSDYLGFVTTRPLPLRTPRTAKAAERASGGGGARRPRLALRFGSKTPAPSPVTFGR